MSGIGIFSIPESKHFRPRFAVPDTSPQVAVYKQRLANSETGDVNNLDLMKIGGIAESLTSQIITVLYIFFLNSQLN